MKKLKLISPAYQGAGGLLGAEPGFICAMAIKRLKISGVSLGNVSFFFFYLYQDTPERSKKFSSMTGFNKNQNHAATHFHLLLAFPIRYRYKDTTLVMLGPEWNETVFNLTDKEIYL